MKVIGTKAHIARLKRLSGPAMVREAGKALLSAASIHAADAAVSISTSSSGGDSGGKYQHVPSLPGQAPNSDSGFLAANIEAAKTGPLTAESSSNAPYSLALEKGTSRMAERPFMRPATVRVRPKLQQFMRDAIKTVLKGNAL